MVDLSWGIALLPLTGGWLCRRLAGRPDRRRRRRADDAAAHLEFRRAPASRGRHRSALCLHHQDRRRLAPSRRGACRLADRAAARDGHLPAAILLLAVMAFLPVDTAAMAHWIRYGLVSRSPSAGSPSCFIPSCGTRRAARRTKQSAARSDGLFGVVLGLLVTLTSVGAGAIGVTVLAALFPAAGQAPGRHRHRPCRAAHAGRGRRPSRPRQCRFRRSCGAALRVDPRHPARRAARRRRARTGCSGRSSRSPCATRPTCCSANRPSAGNALPLGDMPFGRGAQVLVDVVLGCS